MPTVLAGPEREVVSLVGTAGAWLGQDPVGSPLTIFVSLPVHRVGPNRSHLRALGGFRLATQFLL